MKTLCVMVKAPVIGLAKTRLARDIGAAAAIGAYRCMVALILRRLSRDMRWRVVLAVAPDGLAQSRAFPLRFLRLPQGRGDLGVRMQRVFDRFRREGPVLIVGSDIPDIAPRHVAKAFRVLSGHDAVLGPAPDGGYWAIGIGRRRRLAPFANVRWSSPHARRDTLDNLKGARVGLLDELADVDTAEEWRAWTRQPPSRRFRGV
jgi:hypothetical protein